MATNLNGAADLQRWREPPVYRLLSTGSLLSGLHQNKVWRGMAQVPESLEPGKPMIIKWMPRKEVLAAELACSVAAQALRLPVPPGVLVLAQKDELPGLPLRVRGAGTDILLCFGSELQWPDDTMARPKQADEAEEWVWQKVCETNHGPVGGVWDELVVNSDRHCENLVFDGQKWWLIDHECTLPSVARVMKRFAEQVARQGVIDDRAMENTLAQQVLMRRPNDHKMDALPPSWNGQRQRLNWLADQARHWTTGISEVDTVLMMTEVYLRGIDLRLPALALHLSKRLTKPESTSLWNSSNSKNPGETSASTRSRRS